MLNLVNIALDIESAEFMLASAISTKVYHRAAAYDCIPYTYEFELHFS